MKNPFRRRENEVDKQIAALREISEAMQEAADRVAIETSAPMLKRKLAELDPRLLDLIMDQAQYETIVGYSDLSAGSRMRAVTACRFANRTDVQIGNAQNTWTDWGFGRSVDIRAVDDGANEIWQECWTAARNRAIFGQRFIHELSKQILTDGELFFIGYASRVDGKTTWRTLKTEQVPHIVHAEDDAAINVWYIVTLDGEAVAIPDAFTLFSDELRNRFDGVALPHNVTDINQTDGALANGGTYAVIVPAMRNRDDDGRGWPEFHKALAWSSVYSQMLREYSAVFSAVAMFVDKVKVKGGQRTVDDVIAALQSSLVTGGGYSDTNPRPAAGSTWMENESLDRTRMPLGSAAGDAQTGTGILALQLATGLGVKASDVGRVDMFQNKATADIAAESPQQRWQRYQLFWADVWGDVVETTLRLYGMFTRTQFSSYEAGVSSTLPLDLDTTEIAQAMDAINKAAAAMTMGYDVAARANLALAELLLLDLGVADVDAILQTPQSAEAAALPAAFGESHTPVTVPHRCPLCGYHEAYSYEGHGGLLVCAGCGKTYDPSIE
jgi:hypothetical protein